MPYYKKKYKRRYRKRYYKKNNSVAYKALKLAKRLKSHMNVEYKFIDTEDSVNPDTTGVSGIHLNPIPQDDTSSGRDGESVKMKSHTLTGIVEKNSSATITYVRVAIALDNRANQASLAYNLIYDTTGTLDYIAKRQLDGTKQIKVLKVWQFTLTEDKPAITFQYNRKMNTKAEWKSSNVNGIATDMTEGKLVITAISNELVNTPGFSYKSRIRYVDN